MQKKNPTLQNVADAAGVSTATVSRCLNQPEKVRPEVRDKITQAIQTLGYVPHGAARALASRRTRTIGAVVPTIDNALFSGAIQPLQRGLTKANYTLLLANSNYSLDEELREVLALLSRGIDGLVLVGEHHHDEVFDAIKRHRIPYVNLWIYNPESTYSCIGFDHLKAGAQLAKHLVSLGHKNLAVISGILNDNDRAIQRLAGVREYLSQQGIKLPKQRIIECRYSVEQGRLALHNIMQQYPDTTAVICGNDILALGALCATRERNINVPQHLSITGFDNLEIIPALSPALTTINAPSRRMGAQAAQYIINQVEKGTQDPTRVELTAELVIRETTAKARI